ncbi:MAG: M17 family metallopeptidase [Planctomycetota bacterium]
MADFTYPSSTSAALRGAETVLVLVPESRIGKGWLRRAFDTPWRPLLEKAAKGVRAGPGGRTVSCVNPDRGPTKLVLGILPDGVSRHNAPARPEAVAAAVAAAETNSGRTTVIACLEKEDHALPVARAVARATPLFSRATNGKKGGKKRPRRLAFLGLDLQGHPVRVPKATRAVVARSRWAAELVDTPTADMSTADFEKAVRKAARGLPHVRIRSIKGAALLEKKLRGIHAVGRTATVAPRLLLVEYRPPRARRKLAIVGKGIVYDTGGLSLKPTQGMVGMKCDMGGAAAAMGATLALAEGGAKEAVVGVASLAENAIGPSAYRPDDIITFHSGKTVEINNTDAEGRLVLADAVSYVGRNYELDAILDAATLTGAALVATGVRHAAVVSNRAGLEDLARRVGRETGDLVFPLPFAPEFFQEEFKSKVADMKNSVANRMNAQTSCAAQFIYSHIEDLDLPWLHVDLAGPAFRDERATGYGVALLAGLARAITDRSLAD